jgi:hypothetical protein
MLDSGGETPPELAGEDARATVFESAVAVALCRRNP